MKLKACPFCGGEAEYETSLNVSPLIDNNGAYVDYDDMSYWERVYCKECGVEISIADDEKDEITIEKWNKRTDVKHGNWDYSEKEDGECPWYFCSVCDSPAEQLYTDEPLLSEFCPHCGADMRGKQNEGKS